MTNTDDKLGFVLSGGGARGAFVAGVLERLEEDPRFNNPCVVAGTSAGAINAALLASGRSPQEMRQFWLELSGSTLARTNGAFFRGLVAELARALLSDPLRTLQALRRRARRHPGIHPGSFLARVGEVLLADRYDLVRTFLGAMRESHMVDTTDLRAQLIDTFGGVNVPTPRCALAINVVDAMTNRAVRFVNRETAKTRADDYVVVDQITVDMVLASASLPLLFPPVTIDHRLLWDGGVLNNTPMAPAVALGAERIVTVLVTDDSACQEPRFADLAHALARLADMILENAHNVDRSLLLTRNKLARASGESDYREILLYDVIRPTSDQDLDAASFLYFERGEVERLYASGMHAASAWLRTGPRVQGPVSGASQAAANESRTADARINTRKGTQHGNVA